MRLYFANDTEVNKHAGCAAVMRSLRAALAAIPDLTIVGENRVGAFDIDQQEWDSADILFINGEGSIHHSSRRAMFLLLLIDEAKAAGKKVLLVNSIFQQFECPSPDTLAGLALLTVREPRSAAFARCFGGAPVTLLDSAADPAFLASGKALPLKSGVVIGGAHKDGLIKEPFDGIQGQVLSLNDASFEDTVATLRTAEVYLTAQHHGMYAAALAGCPFVATPSLSHKIESFIDWTGLPIPICLKKSEISAAMKFVRRNRSVFTELQQFMTEQSVLTTAMIADALR